MYSFSPRRDGRSSDPRLHIYLLIAGTIGILVACGADDPAEPTGSAGTGSAPEPNVVELPGDGLDRTPDFDVNERRVIYERPDSVSEAIDARSDGSPPPSTPDAGPSDAGDDANGPI